MSRRFDFEQSRDGSATGQFTFLPDQENLSIVMVPLSGHQDLGSQP